MEVEKSCKRLEHDKEQLKGSLEEMEMNLNRETTKVERSYIDVNNYKKEVERRIIEKDEEIDNQRSVVIDIWMEYPVYELSIANSYYYNGL